MGNLDCSNLTIDTQNEIKSADFNRKNTYISKNNILKINAPIRNTKKSKTSSPKSQLSLKEINFVFSDNNKNKEESKNDQNYFRRSFTPRRRKTFKISPDISTSNKKEENKNFKNYKNKEKETKDNEDNDMNKKGVILKKGKSSPLEVICEQIEDEKKVLDTTRTFKNKDKDKNINDKNNSIILNNNIKNSERTQKDLFLNDSNEINNNKLNNNDYYSEKSENTEKDLNENNDEDNSIIKKKEIGLYFNHTGSSKGEEDYKQEDNNEIIINDNKEYEYNDNNYNCLEDKEYKRKIVKEKYKNLYKKYYRNKYYKELNWRNIKIDSSLLTKDEKDILLQGEFLVLNNIKEINSTLKSKYLRFLTLTKIEINIYRSKEKYIYFKSPLINISLFNISKCDLFNKNDININKYNNLNSLLLKYSFFIQFTTVRSMIIYEPNKKYRFSNPFIRSTFHKRKSVGKFSNKPKDIELIQDINIKTKGKDNNDDLNNVNNGKNNDDIDKIQYIVISSDNCELILNLVAIINNLRK